MEFHLENPLQNFHNFHSDAISCLFLIESDHIPSQNYSHTLNARDLHIFVRTEVVSIISQLSCNLEPLLSYLAVNYLDRFLAKQVMKPKPWSLRLLAISCFSLAAKMTSTEYSTVNVQALMEQRDGGIIFQTKTVHRMEAIILGALQWRMRSITPFSFVTFFINLFTLKDPPMREILQDRVAEIIRKSQRDIKLLEFKPSIIAASALLCASHELFPFQYPSFFRAISDCSYVNKESVVQCYSLILDIAAEEECVSSSITPVNVLDHHFPSDQINGITVARIKQDNKDHKRRKINGYGNNQRVHISRIKQC